MEQGGLDHFSQLLDLLLTPTNIAVGHIRLLLHLKRETNYTGAQKLLISKNPIRKKSDNTTDFLITFLLSEFGPWWIHTCIMVTVGSILGGRGMWI